MSLISDFMDGVREAIDRASFDSVDLELMVEEIISAHVEVTEAEDGEVTGVWAGPLLANDAMTRVWLALILRTPSGLKVYTAWGLATNVVHGVHISGTHEGAVDAFNGIWNAIDDLTEDKMRSSGFSKVTMSFGFLYGITTVWDGITLVEETEFDPSHYGYTSL